MSEDYNGRHNYNGSIVSWFCHDNRMKKGEIEARHMNDMHPWFERILDVGRTRLKLEEVRLALSCKTCTL